MDRLCVSTLCLHSSGKSLTLKIALGEYNCFCIKQYTKNEFMLLDSVFMINHLNMQESILY